jgi:hypothetical protein
MTMGINVGRRYGVGGWIWWGDDGDEEELIWGREMEAQYEWGEEKGCTTKLRHINSKINCVLVCE